MPESVHNIPVMSCGDSVGTTAGRTGYLASGSGGSPLADTFWGVF